MTALSEFLLARLDEDEMVATEASRHTFEPRAVPDGGAQWQWVCADDDTVIEPDPGLDEFLGHHGHEDHWCVYLGSVQTFPHGSFPGHGPTILGHIEEMPTAPALHITRHDPARVLADVKAKRRIVIMIMKMKAEPHLDLGDDMVDYAMIDVMELMSTAYADHPDYQKQWTA